MAKIGTVKFQHLARKYAIFTDPSYNKITEVFEGHWKLKRPKYLIFVVDGIEDYNLPSDIRSAFTNGLRNTIEKGDVWVISSGEGHISEYVKEAIHTSYSESVSIISIGITTLHNLEQKNELLQATEPLNYIPDDDGNKYLDLESYTHFLLLDFACDDPVFADGTFGILQTLVTAVSKMDSDQSEIDAVLLVPPGNESNIDTMEKAMEAHIPLVILHGHTGVATTLYKCYQKLKRNENTAQTNIMPLLSSPQRRLKYETVKGIVGKDDNLVTFQKNVVADQRFIQVAIIKALMKGKTQLQEKAKVAFALNNLDIAVNEIMKQSTILAENDIMEFLFTAVKEEKVDFVELCLKLSYDKLISKKDLEQLFVKKGNKVFDVFLADRNQMHQEVVPMVAIESLMTTLIKVKYSFSEEEYVDCYTGLFLRSIILNEQKLAKVLWKNGKTQEKIEKALVGYGVLQKMCKSKKIRDRQITSKLAKDAEEFNVLAMEELNKLYEDNKSKDVLERKTDVRRRTPKDTTTIQLVALTDNKEFMSLEACQSWLDTIWSGENHLQEEYTVSPRNIFFLHSILYIVFLFLYSYHLLIILDKSMSYMDATLVYWVTSFLMEEIFQVYKISPTSYIRYPWNVLRVVAISLFAFGMGVKFLPSNHTMAAARIILGMGLVTFYLRFLEICYNFEKIGPKLEIMKKMFVDLMYFMAIMVVFMLAYAVVSYSLVFPNSTPSGYLIADVFKAAYWNIYGSLFFDDFTVKEPDCSNDPSVYNKRILPRCPGEIGEYTGIIMMGVYVLVCNILLLNILIAMFSASFNRIEKTSYCYSSMQRYFLVMEYKTRLPLPAPFTLLALVAYIVRKIYKGVIMTGAVCGARNVYTSGAPGFTSGFYRDSCSPVIYVSYVFDVIVCLHGILSLD